jgi:hypothetical protein
MNTEKQLRMVEAQKLYEEYGAMARDLATRLLGDPFQADRVTRRVFARLLDPEVPLPMKRLESWVTKRVIERALRLTGNREVADWDAYLDNHPEERPRWRAKDAARRREAQLAATESSQPTPRTLPARKAREHVRTRRDLGDDVVPSRRREPTAVGGRISFVSADPQQQ